MPQRFDCVCRKRFTEERFLTRHVAQCKTVLERREKAFARNRDRSARSDTSGPSSAKRPLSAAQSSGAFATMLHSTLGLGKGRRLLSNSQIQDPLSSTPRSANLDNYPHPADLGQPAPSLSSHCAPHQSSSESDWAAIPPLNESEDVTPHLPSEPELPPKRLRFFSWKKRLLQPEPLPEGPGPLDKAPNGDSSDESVQQASTSDSAQSSNTSNPVVLRIPRIFRTVANAFHLSRLYRRRPTRVPDADATFADMLSDHVNA